MEISDGVEGFQVERVKSGIALSLLPPVPDLSVETSGDLSDETSGDMSDETSGEASLGLLANSSLLKVETSFS